jgi:hypothetical protein
VPEISDVQHHVNISSLELETPVFDFGDVLVVQMKP